MPGVIIVPEALEIGRAVDDLNRSNQDWYNSPPQDAKVRGGKASFDRTPRSSAPSAVGLSVPMLYGLI